MPNGLVEFLEEAEETVGIAPDVEYTISMYMLGEGFKKRAGVYGGQHCYRATVLNICGSGKTGSDGEAVLSLENFVCSLPARPHYGRKLLAPIYFVATPYSNKPTFLTFTVDVEGQDAEPKFRIKVFSWDADGRPSRDIVFNWHCCVNTVEVADETF